MVENPEEKQEDVLTCIHPAYTVSANLEYELSEADKIMIDNLINTLAEIALSIASRESESDEVIE